MKINYKLSNLLGTVYKGGNISFTPDSSTIISPLGNRVTFFDLRGNRSETLPIESQFDITIATLNPAGTNVILVNTRGEALYVSLISRTVLHRHRFNKTVRDIQFSPDGKRFAVCRDTDIQVFRAPGSWSGSYNPFYLETVYHASHDATNSIDWSTDSRLFATGCSDMKTVVCGGRPFKNVYMYSVGGHTGSIVATFFEKDSYDLITIDNRGFLVHWECNLDAGDLVPCTSADAPGPSELRGQSESQKDVAADGADDGEDPDGADGKTKKKKKKKALKGGKDGSGGATKIVYKKINRHAYHSAVPGTNIRVTAAAFNKAKGLLVTGFDTGAFTLHDMPEFNLIHNLRISEDVIGSVTISPRGDWLGLACGRGRGQLVVWEWESESFVMKQQGHLHNTTCLEFSPDSGFLATGGEDGKVKIWESRSGMCLTTFSEHKGNIVSVGWTQGGKAVLSASVDGTIRAFDMKRYRNFRTLTTPEPTQFSCMAIDASGEVVAAGSSDAFDVYIWSLQNGRLLDILAGHTGPVSGVEFNRGESTHLLTTAWDKTMRVWDVFEGKGRAEVIDIGAEGLCGRFSPNGRTAAALTLDSTIVFFDWRSGEQTGSIECRLDLDAGRGQADRITAKTSKKYKSFTTFAFSPEGEAVLVGGQSKDVAIYSVIGQIMLKKFTVTMNYSLDAVADDIDRRNMSEFGSLALVDGAGEDSDDDGLMTNAKRKVPALPGVRQGDASQRAMQRPEIRVTAVQFASTGREWACSTTEGLLLYSLDNKILFDPFQLESSITPQSTRSAVRKGEFGAGLLMALKLNQGELLREAFQQIPPGQVDGIAASMPVLYVEKLLAWLSSDEGLLNTVHLQFYMKWVNALLFHHGEDLKARNRDNMKTLVGLEYAIAKVQSRLKRICKFNLFGLEYIVNAQSQLVKEKAAAESYEGSDPSDLKERTATGDEQDSSDEEDS